MPPEVTLSVPTARVRPEGEYHGSSHGSDVRRIALHRSCAPPGRPQPAPVGRPSRPLACPGRWLETGRSPVATPLLARILALAGLSPRRRPAGRARSRPSPGTSCGNAGRASPPTSTWPLPRTSRPFAASSRVTTACRRRGGTTCVPSETSSGTTAARRATIRPSSSWPATRRRCARRAGLGGAVPSVRLSTRRVLRGRVLGGRPVRAGVRVPVRVHIRGPGRAGRTGRSR